MFYKNRTNLKLLVDSKVSILIALTLKMNHKSFSYSSASLFFAPMNIKNVITNNTKVIQQKNIKFTPTIISFNYNIQLDNFPFSITVCLLYQTTTPPMQKSRCLLTRCQLGFHPTKPDNRLQSNAAAVCMNVTNFNSAFREFGLS